MSIRLIAACIFKKLKESIIISKNYSNGLNKSSIVNIMELVKKYGCLSLFSF